MQVYYEVYKILDWLYWFDVFVLSFVIFVTIGVIVYSLYQDQKNAIETLNHNLIVTLLGFKQSKVYLII